MGPSKKKPVLVLPKTAVTLRCSCYSSQQPKSPLLAHPRQTQKLFLAEVKVPGGIWDSYPLSVLEEPPVTSVQPQPELL